MPVKRKVSKKKVDFLITDDQGKFVRKLRWENMLKKVF